MARTHVENEARREPRLAAILRATGTGTWEWTSDSGRVRLDEEWLAVLGYSPGTLETTPDALFALVHPDDQPRVRGCLQAHLDGLTAECECVGRLRRHDGTYQGRRERCVVVERGPDGAPRRIVGLGTNVTDLGQAGEQAPSRESVPAAGSALPRAAGASTDTLPLGRGEASDERFRMVARATRDVLWDWDLVTGAHWWSPNAVELFGYDPNAEPDITAWRSRMHPDDAGRVETLVQRVLADTLDTLDGEYRFRLADGTYGEFLDRGHVVRDASGHAVRMIGAMTDVTELKRAHRSLMAAHERLQAASRDVHLTESRERAALARELHDEFGQLLTAAKLSASSLRAMPLDGLPEVRRQQHAEKAANLCDVLDMALHGIRNVATQLRPPALDQLGLARALEGLAAQIERHAGLACTVTIDKATRARVFGPVEGAALYRMVQELVNNAARHAAAATVRVDLTTADGLVHLVVTDDGRGFPPEDARPAGTLGLKGLRERAELLGGRIAIHSRPGAGTSVHVTIPAGDGA